MRYEINQLVEEAIDLYLDEYDVEKEREGRPAD